MPQIKVDRVVNKNDTGAPELARGATIPSGQIISGSGSINVTGIVTATTFVGSGLGISGISVTTQGKAIGMKKILGFDEYRA